MSKPDFSSMLQQLSLTPQQVIDAIDDLNEWICLHTKFANLQQKIMNSVAGRSRDLLIVVIGPARVGKTTLFESIAGMTDELARIEGRRRGCFRFSVPPPDHRGRFDWKSAILQAYSLSQEILPFQKIVYGDTAEGAPTRRTSSSSGAAAEEALWLSFIKNIQLEKLFTIVDEGNTIPVTLSELQVVRAIHALKYIIAQTKQPLLIGGTSAVKYIVEHDTQLKVRTKLLTQDPYGDNDEDIESIRSFLDQMEQRLGPNICKAGCLVSHANEINKKTDGRPGLIVRVATDALSQHGHNLPLDWPLYKHYLDLLENYAAEDLATERCVTRKAIIAAAEAATRQKLRTVESVVKRGRVGARKNTNAPNHPYE
ncbi:hypothetical protein [Paraburkholderia tropica]|uniref:hypothetical protein n=1 Tax=Paraburkholderia tropica TaxID=92647 RepID=UPI002ABDA544|nr:hypothetical protein [Paraburkholderia tropica]